MRLSGRITVGDVESVIVAKPVDIIKWETGTKRKLTDGLGYGDLLQILHSAAKRQELTNLAFSDWAATLDDFAPEVDEADPTQTVPSADT